MVSQAIVKCGLLAHPRWIK